jgi:hypothetical protein
VGANGGPGSGGDVYVYLGGAAGLSTSPIILDGPGDLNAEFGFSAACAGDINGDGLTDIVVGAEGVAGFTGAAYLYLADGAAGLGPRVPLALPAGKDWGTSVSSAGDTNGDGFSDVVIGNYSGTAALFTGGQFGVSGSPTTLNAGGPYFTQVSPTGDVNGDGFGDFLVASAAAQMNSGAVSVFLGAANGVSSTPSFSLGPPQGFAFFGLSVASVKPTLQARGHGRRRGPK